MKTRKVRKSKRTSTLKKQTNSEDVINEDSYSNNTEETLDSDLEPDRLLLSKNVELGTLTLKRDLRRRPVRKDYEINYKDEQSNSSKMCSVNTNEEKSSGNEKLNFLRKENENDSYLEEKNRHQTLKNNKKDGEDVNNFKVDKSRTATLKRRMQSINKDINSVEKGEENREESDPSFEKKNKSNTSKKRKGEDSKAKKTETDKDERDSVSSTEYEVEKIIDVYFKKNGMREFLVRWKGYSPKDDTWEPEKHLNCPNLIENFLKKCEKARDLPAREMRSSRRKTDRYVVNEIIQGRKSSNRLKKGPRKTYYEDL